jgi:hypothetical protein
MDENGCGETKAPSTKLDGVTPQPIQPGEEHLNFSALLVSSVNILRKKYKYNVKIYKIFCGDTAQVMQRVLKVEQAPLLPGCSRQGYNSNLTNATEHPVHPLTR